ncbi:uncharacterized protein LOC110753160 [Prunus avium]|uniref:Uncharacterized protein LOC110753160 n=1 Tax=Prunus avium TaxID=42229 RepID=A0A6P5RY27_PRUAV|nr:uncharacterized protein LOC110753160 [Prunus avium]
MDNNFIYAGEPPNYKGLDPTLWTAEIHHGGQLQDISNGYNFYSGGSVVWVDNLNRDYMSPFDFDDFAKKLGYQERVGYYYRVPEGVNGVQSKLVCITNDEVFNNMFDNLLQSRVVVIYFSHGISCGLLESQASINNHYVQQIDIFQTERQQSNTLQPEKFPQSDVLEFNWVYVDVQEEEATTESDDEFIDSDYEQDEEGLGVSFEQNEDDVIYDQNVEGSNKEDIQNEIGPEEQEFDEYNSEDLKSLDGNSSSDEEPNTVNRRRMKKKLSKFKQFRRETDIRTIEFHLGMVFANAKEFKEAVKWHFVNHCRSYKFKINDWYKVKAVCKAEPCPWSVYASSNDMSDRHSPLHVKTLVQNHTCGTDENNTSVTITWLAKRYADDLSINPKMDVKTMKAMVRKAYMAEISRWKAYRARSIVNEKLEGSYQEQYSILRDYCEELKRSNLGSTIMLKTELEGEKTMKAMVRKDYMAEISRWKAYRARSIVNEKLEGSYQEQYSILRDYCEELKRSNQAQVSC